MQIKVKPVIVVSKRDGWFYRPDGSMELKAEGEALAGKVAELNKELKTMLQCRDALLEATIVRNENDLVGLEKEALDADALLVYLMGVMPLNVLLQWGLPIVVFSGQYTPSLALYAFGVERHGRPGIAIALDFQDIDDEIRLLEAKKRFKSSRIALFGFPPPMFSRWHHLPDIELIRERLGIEFSPMEIGELVSQWRMTDTGEAQALAERWMQEAKGVVEPTRDDVTDSARLFLALTRILKQRKANAMTINCIELMNSESLPPCYAMSRLLDEGIYAGCEGDVTSLLSMMLLGYLANEPAFMGNIVWANPESNILKISHCVVPTRMAGFSQPPRSYTLRNHHERFGVTAYVELDIRQEVTIARLARNLKRILILQGEIVDCQDTTSCRTTVSVKVADVREFGRQALGNHHALVYGNHVRQTKALSRALGISTAAL